MSEIFQHLKKLANTATRSSLVPLVSAMKAEQALLGPSRADSIFQTYSQIVSLVPGIEGEYLRRAFYALALPRCGDDFTVGFGTVFSKQEVEIGHRVYVGMHCTIGNALLGDHVTIGSNVDILSGSGQHNFDDLDTPIQDQGGSYSIVSIGDNSWLGNGAIIMADIGRDCVIGAGSVVAKEIPDRVLAAGNPARVIRER